MTHLAIQRLFAQHCGGGGGAGGDAGGGGQMDFAAFCTFCAAWEQRHRPASVRYFFPLLDLRGCGYLTQVGAGSCNLVLRSAGLRWRQGDEGAPARLHLPRQYDCLPALLPTLPAG